MLSFLFLIPQWIRLTISGVYLGLIIFLSLLPPNDFPDIPLFKGADKIIHTSMYLGLTCLVCWSVHAENKPIWYYLIAIFSISWGIIMEIFQFSMHMGRSFDGYDIIGNSIGTLIGLIIYIGLTQIWKNKMAGSSKL